MLDVKIPAGSIAWASTCLYRLIDDRLIIILFVNVRTYRPTVQHCSAQSSPVHADVLVMVGLHCMRLTGLVWLLQRRGRRAGQLL